MHFIEYAAFRKTKAFFSLEPGKAHFGLIITLLVIIVGTGLFSAIAPMDDIIKVAVVLRPQDSISIVRCVQEGELSQKMYNNGDFIHKGDLLFSLDATALKLEKETNEARLLQVTQDIKVFKTLLETMRTGTLPDVPKETEEYRRSAAYIFEKEYYEALIKDLAIKLKRESSKPDALRIIQNIQDAQTEYDKTILQYNSWFSVQSVQAIEQYKQLQTERRALEARVSSLERSIRNTVMIAPISGRLTEVRKLNIGDYILPSEEIIRIVPEDKSSLKAELSIDPAFIARVTVAKEVKIRFPGLPPSRYGQLLSRISLVPPDYTIGDSGTPVFIVEAEIEEPWLISRQGEKTDLLPGMTAEGRIITERSTILRMVLRKLDFLL